MSFQRTMINGIMVYYALRIKHFCNNIAPLTLDCEIHLNLYFIVCPLKWKCVGKKMRNICVNRDTALFASLRDTTTGTTWCTAHHIACTFASLHMCTSRTLSPLAFHRSISMRVYREIQSKMEKKSGFTISSIPIT